MIRCTECESWFAEPELRQPINWRTGHVRWDEDHAACCPECGMPLDGDEVTGEPCEVCEYHPAVANYACAQPECQAAVT